MPIDQRELRNLLNERSSPALDRPIPWHSLRARTRGARRRRFSAVAAAATFAVAVVAGGTVVSLRGPDQPTTAQVTEKLPSQYEESDGTVYRRLATATFDPARQASLLFEVEVSDKPVAILPDCPFSQADPPHVSARAAGLDKTFTLSPAPFLMNACERGRAVDMQPFPAGTRTVIFTIKGSPGRTAPGEWRFGVYEWTPPSAMKPASPPAEPPAKLGKELNLAAKATTTWPDSREVTVTVPNKGLGLAVATSCGDGLGDRLGQKVWVNGRHIKGGIGCSAAPEGGGFLYLGRQQLNGKTTTIRVRLETPIPEYLHRPGTLTVAVYTGDM